MYGCVCTCCVHTCAVVCACVLCGVHVVCVHTCAVVCTCGVYVACACVWYGVYVACARVHTCAVVCVWWAPFGRREAARWGSADQQGREGRRDAGCTMTGNCKPCRFRSPEFSPFAAKREKSQSLPLTSGQGFWQWHTRWGRTAGSVWSRSGAFAELSWLGHPR